METQARQKENDMLTSPKNVNFTSLSVTKRNEESVALDINKIRLTIAHASKGLDLAISVDELIRETLKIIYDGISTTELAKALALTATTFIEKDIAYNYVAARLFMQYIYKQVLEESYNDETIEERYQNQFIKSITKGLEVGLLDPRLKEYDLETLSQGIRVERDNLFGYIGIETLYGRYLIKHGEKLIEMPQIFWMRVAMGLALSEENNKTARALEFYEVLSTLRFVSSTPTLFRSGMHHPQLSSCYLNYISDDLNHIFKTLQDNANLSKWSGGLGTSWTAIRGTGSMISSINVTSQGTVPFLKLANDVVAAISRAGSRRAAACAYLEAWHYDFEDFIDLRRNTGDDRRRTHDMNTASWIPDLFMKRLINDEQWTLFSPDETPDLHEIYGKEFEAAYLNYEAQARAGKIRLYKTVSAKELWKKMLTRLFETGHPWITFKDPCNVRSPQDHVGVVHSSNLCTEITLNTSPDETAVCNLGSINLARHIFNGKIDRELLADTVKTAIRMLDNVIDINFYPTKEARNSNLRHRPIGMGMMGLQDALFMLDIPFDDTRALEFSDTIMEFISYNAIMTSSKLSQEKGAYSTYAGSKWDRGILPMDTIDLLEQERGMKIDLPRTTTMDWSIVREHIKQHGMRNSNLMAIAPTATIANISGCYPCIEPIYKNIYVKANMSGEFTVINAYLVQDLKKLGLWSQDMLDQIKYYDGSIQNIDAIPDQLKRKYKEAFELDPEWLVKITATRGRWIDQSQSHNVFMLGTSGKKLNDIYLAGWKLGIKTFYYLRSLGASQIEKSTLDAKKFGYTQKREFNNNSKNATTTNNINGATYCGLNAEDCEACQ
ncbi:MAG: ribonucleoside-diphosphate reductase subunit alpha [Epsilonproteobacteria bacterium]|nr:ribonucleoside-diphosphate reductase subunit alpha [Campylobacterota bacterium]